MAGCANGHLDDFPWVRFAHDGNRPCGNPVLRVNDVGSGGRATDLLVTCLTCEAKSTLAKAFGPAAKLMMPMCRGRHPHLGVADRVFDTSLLYEVSVLKVFAERYLLEVPRSSREYSAALRLRRLLTPFVTISPDHVPPTSILREFIGERGFRW